MLTMFSDLWSNVQMFLHSLLPLFWMMVFILSIIFIFAMFTIVLIGRSSGGSEEYRISAQAFETTMPAMVSLLQIMT